ncbi:MAG: hypothetical protein ACI4GC_05565 [Acutalibacteraceae bacterium]
MMLGDKTGLTQGRSCTSCGTVIEAQETIPQKHTDNNSDGKCDDCGTTTCDHICHKGGFSGFIWKIMRAFMKLFKSNPVCSCGAKHY